ncbi:WD40 repeat, subgroup [Pseudofrankia inefficax]|uniref:WD40 repeat, subgroup n=1 Tax=Pseudofrankia inefficax (strain DSM 45817 / CECT 9037 / DDB 130130 / EuI1c) TaxID=298654 RepID=E3J542_PSEI1|nr:WD40 repeat, subgroup [Pseudofrankia inefficax]
MRGAKICAVGASGASPQAKAWDFFVSYTRVDRTWAEWVAWHLEEAGYSVLIEAWDFVPGTNWRFRMGEGAQRAERTIAILSAAYLKSVYGEQEWQAAQAADPNGFARKLLPIRVEDCLRPSLLDTVVSIDLFDRTAADAPQHLLDQVQSSISGRAKPTTQPTFPISVPDSRSVDEHAFPSPARRAPVPPPTDPGPLCEPFTGNVGGVVSLAFAADGHTLATVGADWSVRLWDVTDPTRPEQISRPLTGQTGGVVSVAFAANGHILATVGVDWLVRLWDITDPARPEQIGHPLTGHAGGVVSVAFAANGHTLATVGYDWMVRLWDITDPARPEQTCQILTGHRGGVVSVAFAADGHTLATVGCDGTVRLWDVTDPARPGPIGEPLTGYVGTAMSVAFAADGHTLATVGCDRMVRLWDVADRTRPRPIGQPLTGHTEAVMSVAFTANGHTLATGDHDGTVRLWRMY